MPPVLKQLEHKDQRNTYKKKKKPKNICVHLGDQKDLLCSNAYPRGWWTGLKLVFVCWQE